MAVIKTKWVCNIFWDTLYFTPPIIISHFSSSYHFSFFILLIEFLSIVMLCIAMFSDETIRQSSNSWNSAFLGQVCRWGPSVYTLKFFSKQTFIFFSFSNVMPGVPMATTPGFLNLQEYNQHNQCQQYNQTDQCTLRLLVKWWSQGCQVGATAQKGENNLQKFKMLKHRKCVSANKTKNAIR